MSGPDLILNFILGVLASYLAAEIRERPQYVYLTLKNFLDVTRGLCYRVSFRIFSLLKMCVILAGTKLTSLTTDVRSSPLALFITITFLLTVVAPFKAGKETDRTEALVAAQMFTQTAYALRGRTSSELPVAYSDEFIIIDQSGKRHRMIINWRLLPARYAWRSGR